MSWYLAVDIQHSKGKTGEKIAITGELTIYTVTELLRRLRAIPDLGKKNLTLDLSAVEQLDGAGVQLLLQLKKRMAEDRTLRVNAVNPLIEPVFQLLHLNPKTLCGATA